MYLVIASLRVMSASIRSGLREEKAPLSGSLTRFAVCQGCHSGRVWTMKSESDGCGKRKDTEKAVCGCRGEVMRDQDNDERVP